MSVLEAIRSESGYAVTLGGTKVRVGGRSISEHDFVAGVNSSFHQIKGEETAFLDINHPDSPMTRRIETQADGVINYKTGGHEHEFYTKEDGTFKWDKIFQSVDDVPDTILYKIEHSINLSFYRQLISKEDKTAGSEYGVPEAHNSFAVYFNDGKRNGRWQTGKVMHIYSPFFVDEVGAKSPFLEMTLTGGYTSKNLTLTQPLAVIAWLNHPDRRGKVRLDPTLGYTTEGALRANTSNFVLAWDMEQATASGPVTALRGYVLGGAVNFKVGVMKTSEAAPNYYASGKNVISQGEGAALGAGVISDCTVANTEDIASGLHYRIIVALQTAGAFIAFDKLLAKTYRRERTAAVVVYAAQFPGSFAMSNQSVTVDYLSIWAEYGVSGGYYYQQLMNNRRGRS